MANLATGGYARASVMPDAGLVDPRLLAADYGQFTQGIGQGLQLVGNYNNNRQLALDRADANSLRGLRLAAQRGQLELEPQLQQNNLELSNRRALEARVTPIELEATQNIALQDRYGAPTNTFTPDNSPEAIEAGILGTYESKPNKLPGQDVVVQEERIVVDPQNGERRIVRSTKQALQTAEQIANVNADNAARVAAIDAQRAGAAAELARKEAAAATAAGFREREVGVREQQEKRLANTPRAGDSIDKRRTALANTILPSGRKLSEYLVSTRNADGTLKQVDAPYWWTGDQPIATDPQAEALAQEYMQLTNQITNMANQPVAAVPVPTVAAESPPAASPVREAASPARPDVRQNGTVYRWNGTQYVPAQ